MTEPTSASASSASQLKTVLYKNFLLKKRAYKTTCCEIFSPALFLSVLVLGYTLSSTNYYGEGNYAKTELNLAPLTSTILPVLNAQQSGNQTLGIDLFGGFGRRQRMRR